MRRYADRIKGTKTWTVARNLAAIAKFTTEAVLAVATAAVAGLIAGDAVRIVRFAGRSIAVRGIRTLRIVFSVTSCGADIPLVAAAIAGVETAIHADLVQAFSVHAGLIGAHDIAVGAKAAVGFFAIRNVDIGYAVTVVVFGVAELERIVVNISVGFIAVCGAAIVTFAAKVAVGIKTAETAIADADEALRRGTVRNNLACESIGATCGVVRAIRCAE